MWTVVLLLLAALSGEALARLPKPPTTDGHRQLRRAIFEPHRRYYKPSKRQEEADTPNPEDEAEWCTHFSKACLSEVNVEDPWSSKACVAGAACSQDIGAFLQTLKVETDASDLPRLTETMFEQFSAGASKISTDTWVNANYALMALYDGPYPQSSSQVVAGLSKMIDWTCGVGLDFVAFGQYFQSSASTESMDGCASASQGGGDSASSVAVGPTVTNTLVGEDNTGAGGDATLPVESAPAA